MSDGEPTLEAETRVPKGARDGARVVVLLHGRGSHRRDLQALGSRLPEGSVLVTPEAPHPGRRWGYGGGWAWYRYVAGARVVGDTLRESLERLHAFLRALPARLPIEPGALVLGGFSQGGTTSMAYALLHPGSVQGVLNFSGFLVDDDLLALENARAAAPVFWGHGTRDPAIPHELAREGRRRLREAGAELEARDYEIGHWISPQELADATRWLEERTG